MPKRTKKKTVGLAIPGVVFLTALLVLSGLWVTMAPAQSDLTVFQKEGATEEQQSQDRYECHQRAVKETGFDPAAPAGAGAPPPPPRDHSISSQAELDKYLQVHRHKQRTQYHRALKTCLEARGFTIVEH